MTKWFASKKIKKVLISVLCFVLVCIVGLSTTIHPGSNEKLGLGMNTVQAAEPITTVSKGWNGSSATINGDYHLKKTITDMGNGTYKIDVYAANVEHASVADVFIIWDNSNSMYNVGGGSLIPQEKTIIKTFLNAIRPNFSSMNIRLSDFGSFAGNDAHATGWTSANSDAAINATLNKAMDGDSYHFSGSQFQLNLATALTEFNSRPSSNVKILLMVADGIPVHALNAISFETSLADEAVQNALALKKKNVTIFSACIQDQKSSAEKYVKGRNLMSQIATNSGSTSSTFENSSKYTSGAFYKYGTYSDENLVNLSSFAEALSVSSNNHFTKRTYLQETINSDYFYISSAPVIKQQKFTGSGFSTTDVAATATLTGYSATNGFYIENYDYVSNKCYQINTTAHGYRLHVSYQIKAKTVSKQVNVNTHKTDATYPVNGSYIDYLDSNGSWIQVILPGLSVTLTPPTYTFYYVASTANETVTNANYQITTVNGIRYITKTDGTKMLTNIALSYSNTNSFTNYGTFGIARSGYVAVSDSQKNNPDTPERESNGKVRPVGARWYVCDINGNYLLAQKDIVINTKPTTITIKKGERIFINEDDVSWTYEDLSTKYGLTAGNSYILKTEWDANINFHGNSTNAVPTTTITQNVHKNEATKLNANEFTNYLTLNYILNDSEGAKADLPGYSNGKTENNNTVFSDNLNATFRGWSNNSGAPQAIAYNDEASITVSADKDLYAQWIAKKVLPEPTRDGYVFKEWNTAANGNGIDAEVGETYSLYTNTNLYAIWEAEQYTVHYNLNGGTGTFADQSATKDQAITIHSASPVKTGYSFAGWTTSSENVLSASDAKYTPGTSHNFSTIGKEVTLYAVWKSDVVFNANGGAFENDTTTKTITKYSGQYTSGDANTINIGSVEVPEQDGYIFMGWTQNADGTGTTYTGSIAPSSKVIYAQWKPVPKWTVTYNANGGTGDVPEAQIKTENVNMDVSFDTIPTRVGYEFVGWDESSSATTPYYTENGNTEYTANKDATLYAVWSVSQYNITYDANGGENAPASQVKTHDININVSSDIPTRDKYEFKGWSDEATQLTVKYQPGDTITANKDMTLTAVWEKIKFKVTYDYATNGGTSVDTEFKMLDPDEPFDTTPVATKDGWEFIGWGEHEYDTEPLAPDFQMPREEITVYAIYKKTITANFYSLDWEGAKTFTADIYNTVSRYNFAGPMCNDIPAKDKFVVNEIQSEHLFTGCYSKRGTSFDNETIELNRIFVTAEEGSADFDAVYRTNLQLKFDYTGGEGTWDFSYLPVYRAFTPTEQITYVDYYTSLYDFPIDDPLKDGYTFAGWYVPDLTLEYQRYTSNTDIGHNQLIDADTWDPTIYEGDKIAYAQWLGNSITSNAIGPVIPGNEIEYTLTTVAGKAAPEVQLLVNIPAHTSLVESSISADTTVQRISEDMLLFSIKNTSDDQEIVKKFKVRVNDDAADGDLISAQLTSKVFFKEYGWDLSSYEDIYYSRVAPNVVNTVSYNYQITYKQNIGEGGTAPVDNNTYAGGKAEVAILKDNTLTKEGYTFVGWLDREAETAYREGDEFVVNKNAEFEALWAKLVLNAECDYPAPGENIKYVLDIEIPDYIDEADIKDILPGDVDIEDVEFIPVTPDIDDPTTDPGETGDGSDEVKKYEIKFDITSFYPGTENYKDLTEEVVEGGKVTAPNVADDDNYTLAYWYTDDSYTGTIDESKIFNFNTSITSDTTIYGIWKAKEAITYHTVTFVMGDHGTAIDAVQVPDGAYLTRPGTQVDGEYYVLCWYIDDSFTDINNLDVSKLVNFNKPITEDMTIYAAWAKMDTQDTEENNTPVIDYKDTDVDNPDHSDNDEVNVHLVKINGINKYRLIINAKIREDAAPGLIINNKAEMVTKTNYTVESNEVSTQVGYIVTYIVGDNYDEEVYHNGTVKYVGDDVMHNVDENGNIIYYQEGEKAPIIAPSVGEYETFVNWNTAIEGNGAEIEAGEEAELHDNLTLFSNVIYLRQEVKDKQVDYVPEEEYTVIIHVKAPYDGQLTLFNTPEAGTEILELINKNDNFINSFDLNNGDISVVLDVEKDQEYEVKLKCKVTSDAAPKSTSGVITTAEYLGENYDVNEDKIDINNYFTVTYNANGADGEVPVDETYYREGEKATVLSADDISLEGYIFGAWNTSENGDGDEYQPDDEAEFTSDTTLYAQWITSSELPQTGSAQLISLGVLISALGAGYIYLKKRENA